MVNKFHFPSFGGGGEKAKKPIINQAIEDKNAALDDIYNYQNQPKVESKKKVKK